MPYTPPTAIIRFDRPLTQAEAAQVLGVTRGAVSHTERKVLKKLQQALQDSGVCLADGLRLPPGLMFAGKARKREGEQVGPRVEARTRAKEAGRGQNRDRQPRKSATL